MANPTNQQELDAAIRVIGAANSALEAEKQKFKEELARSVQQSGRLDVDGVLHRIQQELLELRIWAKEDLTLEQLEVEGLAYRVKGCWFSASGYVREVYLPAMRRAKGATSAGNH
ncbi:MAG: hypothetical protein WCS65_03290 [Verrucomicrobiae bacterium]